MSHYFKNSENYYLKSVLGYIEKTNPQLVIPNCWYEGGSLNEKAREYGFIPSWDNGYEGRGRREKYSGKVMYRFAELLIMDLKSGNIKRRSSKKILPLEELIYEEPTEQCETSLSEPVPVYPVDIEELKQALNKAAEDLIKAFSDFMQMVIDSYTIEEDNDNGETM